MIESSQLPKDNKVQHRQECTSLSFLRSIDTGVYVDKTKMVKYEPANINISVNRPQNTKTCIFLTMMNTAFCNHFGF